MPGTGIATIDPEDPDLRCEWIYDSGPKIGLQCEAQHTPDSPYCPQHGEKQRAKRQKKSELLDRLNDYHDTCSREGIQKVTELLINGVITGVVKKDKAGPLAVFLPFAWKMASSLDAAPRGGLRIDLTKTTETITLDMSEEELDAYLAGNESVRVEIIEQAREDGKIQIKDRQIVPQDVPLEKIEIDAETLSDISKHTAEPISKKKALKLFGKNLRDTPDVEPDPTHGLDELFEAEIPKEAQHKWKGAYEKIPDSVPPKAALWFTCLACGKRAANSDYKEPEICPGKPKETE